MARHKLLKTFGVLTLTGFFLGCALMFYGLQIEPKSFQFKKYNVETSSIKPEQSGLRVAVLSDIHLGSRFNNLERLRTIISKINAENPDIVLLPGDFINGRSEWGTNYQDFTAQNFVEELAKLKPPHIASFGNHEYIRRKQIKPAALQTLFQQKGMPLLKNDAMQIGTRLGALWVTALDDASKGKPDYAATFENVPNNATILYMTHNPDGFAMLDRNVALAVAGDTHCGQINIFGFRPAIYMTGHIDTFKKWPCGLYKNLPFETIGLVSSGVGTSNFPIRIGTIPQVEIITLEYKKP